MLTVFRFVCFKSASQSKRTADSAVTGFYSLGLTNNYLSI